MDEDLKRAQNWVPQVSILRHGIEFAKLEERPANEISFRSQIEPLADSR